MDKIHNFENFLDDLLLAGFSIGGENNEDVFSLCDYFGDEIGWHTEKKETDPWEWRMRVLHECSDIAYGKFFFQKSGFITKEWYPYFYAIRRGNKGLVEEYEMGNISHFAYRIYLLLEEHKELALDKIKLYGGFQKEDKSKFDAAIRDLQMKFYITMCGNARKKSIVGEEYGWSSTVFCLVEDFFGQEVIDYAKTIDYQEAYEKIEQQIYFLNPNAVEKKVKRFIL